MPAACGVSLGRGRDGVLCVVGDGSAMYSCQSLWTAARRRLPVLFAVLANGRYQILKDNLMIAKGRAAETGHFVGIDLGDPAVDFVALATSMGVPATRVVGPGIVSASLKKRWSSAWQKYCERNSSCVQMICAPCLAARSISAL